MIRRMLLAGTLAVGLALTLGPSSSAQVFGQNQTITVVDSGTACVTAPTACATFALDSVSGGITLSISGTWTGTLTFEGTNNDGIWTAVLLTNLATGARVTTTTASGLFGVGNAGFIKIRVRATAAVTGSALVTAAKGLGQPSADFFSGSGAASAPITLPFNASTATYTPSGVINSQFTPVSNTSIGSEDVLMTYTLPANSLAVNGQGVRVTASGIFAGNTNAKSARIYWAATLVNSSSNIVGAPNGTAWRYVMEVIRTGAATQTIATSLTNAGNGGWTTSTTATETLSGAVIIHVNGLSAVAATDVTARLFMVEALP